MKKSWLRAICRASLCVVLLSPLPALRVLQAQTKTSPKKADAVTPPPSAQEIADARTKGWVWVNLGTGVYHKDGEFYGKPKKAATARPNPRPLRRNRPRRKAILNRRSKSKGRASNGTQRIEG